jgi:hypothetical protein
LGQVPDDDALADAIEESSGKRQGELGCGPGIARRAGEFLDLLSRGEQVELTAAPESEHFGGGGSWRNESADEDVRVEDHAHRLFFRAAFLAFLAHVSAGRLDRFVDKGFDLVRRQVGETRAGLLDGLVEQGHLTASSMNFEMAPFFRPWAPR